MSKYINADKLCEDLMSRWEIADKEKEKEIQSIMADVVVPIVVGQPFADVVEVVRCKDCESWEEGKRMRKYINADGLEKALHHFEDCEKTETKYVSLSLIFKAINEEPAADVVEVKHGEWIPCDVICDNYEYCSICNWENDAGFRHYNFCPFCGADMRERRENE